MAERQGFETLEGTVPRLHTFQACAFDHSATSPVRALYSGVARACKLVSWGFFAFIHRCARARDRECPSAEWH